MVRFEWLIFLIVFVSGDELTSRIYTSLTQAGECVKLLTVEGEIGCSTGRAGVTGKLQMVENVDDFNSFLNVQSGNQVALLISSELFTTINLEKLKGSKVLVGLLVMSPKFKGPLPSVYSDDVTSPLWQYDPYSGNFTWNPNGSGIIYKRYLFPILSLSKDESSSFYSRAIDNTNGLSYVVEFNYGMSAHTNSSICLTQASCLPVGGYSVWGSFLPNLPNSTLPTILVATHMDSASLFHSKSFGAEATISGLVALLAAVDAIKFIPVNEIKKQLLFTIFNGESWGFVGSRKFVKDVQNFTCLQFDESGGCTVPFEPVLNFQSINLTNVEALIEVNQFALKNSSVFIHSTHASIYDDLFTNTASSFNISVGVSNVGIPPSSAWSFSSVLNSKPLIVLTDHNSSYTNLFYHSQYDVSLDVIALCNSSSFLAKSLYNISTGKTLETLNTNCSFVQALYYCLSNATGCNDIGQFGSDITSPPSFYPGVYNIQSRQYISGVPRFVYTVLASLLKNNSLSSNSKCSADSDCKGEICGSYGTCVTSYTFYHDAVDTDIYFDYSQYLWRYSPVNGSKSLVFTEPNWGHIGTRIYREEKEIVPWIVFVFGLMITSGTIYGTIHAMKMLKVNFKLD